MALISDQHTRSGTFVKIYLVTWGLLAAGALVYLASLAWQPGQAVRPAARQQVTEAEGSQSIRFATKALKEVSEVRRTVSDMQKDMSELKDTVVERAAETKKVDLRLIALEERVTSMDANLAAGPPSQAQKAADRAAKTPQKAAKEPRQPPRVISTVTPEAAVQPAAKADGPPVPLETGSIAPPQPIPFGAAVVTPSSRPEGHAVQLAAGPSLPALRKAWGEMVERHGAALATLQPRYVAPRSEGGPYRLLAGPLPSKADADRVCADMGVGRNGCYATSYMGEPL